MPHRGFLAQIPLDNGKPDLKLPQNASYWNEWPGRLWHATWWSDAQQRYYYLTVLKLGTIGGDVVVAGVGDNKIVTWLKNKLGVVRAKRFKDAWDDPPTQTWLLAHAVTIDTETGRPNMPITYCGDSPTAVADDYPEPPPEP